MSAAENRDKIVHTFAWHMFHHAKAYGDTVEEARKHVLANRPAWIPEGTALRYVCSRGPRDAMARATVAKVNE